MTIVKRGVRDVEGVEAAFREMRAPRAEVVIVVNSAVFFSHRRRLAEFAVKHRLPTVTGAQEYVEAGALIGYGTDYPDLFRRAAEYVDKILKGAKPGHLPIESLGITVPSALAFRADHLIQ